MHKLPGRHWSSTCATVIAFQDGKPTKKKILCTQVHKIGGDLDFMSFYYRITFSVCERIVQHLET